MSTRHPRRTLIVVLLIVLVAVVPATVLVVAALTAIPAGIGARRSVGEIVQSELA